MLKYIFGKSRYLFNFKVSIFAFVDDLSIISKKATVFRFAKIYKSHIGPYSYIGPRTEIICTNVGKFCSISQDCTIGMASHSMKNISTSPIFTSKINSTGYSWTMINTFQENQPVLIGNDVWIGLGVKVLSGVTIGNGAIIGAGSIITKDIPDYAIAVGIPARVIKYRFDKSIIDRLVYLKWWDMPENVLKSKIKTFQLENFNLKDLNTL